jgi:hypothetical protein
MSEPEPRNIILKTAVNSSKTEKKQRNSSDFSLDGRDGRRYIPSTCPRWARAGVQISVGAYGRKARMGTGISCALRNWRQFVIAATIGLLAVNANAARLGHPSYSASGATPAQKQWNLLCDPPAAVSGSTSTQYNPEIAALDTITAWPGFELTEVDVAVVDLDSDSGYSVDQFFLPPGTTTFVLVPGDDDTDDAVIAPAAATTQPTTTGTTYTGSLNGDVEIGAVQVFWAPYNATPVNTDAVSAAQVVTPAAVNRGGPPNFGGGDVDTHIITFDNVSGNTQQLATFTNYANGNSNFFEYFDVPDSYSGTNFTYTAQQIASSTVTLGLLQPRPPCPVRPQPPCIGGNQGKH